MQQKSAQRHDPRSDTAAARIRLAGEHVFGKAQHGAVVDILRKTRAVFVKLEADGVEVVGKTQRRCGDDAGACFALHNRAHKRRRGRIARPPHTCARHLNTCRTTGNIARRMVVRPGHKTFKPRLGHNGAEAVLFFHARCGFGAEGAHNLAQGFVLYIVAGSVELKNREQQDQLLHMLDGEPVVGRAQGVSAGMGNALPHKIGY